MSEAATEEMSVSSLIAAIITGVVGAFVMFMTPAFVAYFAMQGGLDDRQIGYVAASDINAMAIAMGVAALLLSRMDWRHIIGFGLLLMIAGNATTALANGYALMIAARIVAGVGEGLVVGVSFAAIGQWKNPDWAFAVYLVVGSAFSAVVLWFFPWFQQHVRPDAMFAGNAVVCALTLLCLIWMPARSRHVATSGGGGGAIHVRLAVAGLLGVFVYFLAPGAMWSYFERIGNSNGVSAQYIGMALSFATIAGIGGALIVTVLPRSWGRAWPLIMSGAVSIASFFLLYGQVDALRLILAGALLMASWQFAQPLFSGLCCDADPHGRVVSGMGSIQTIGFGLGPAMSAMLLKNGDFSPIVWASTAAVVVGLCIIVLGGGERAAPVRGAGPGAELSA